MTLYSEEQQAELDQIRSIAMSETQELLLQIRDAANGSADFREFVEFINNIELR